MCSRGRRLGLNLWYILMFSVFVLHVDNFTHITDHKDIQQIPKAQKEGDFSLYGILKFRLIEYIRVTT